METVSSSCLYSFSDNVFDSIHGSNVCDEKSFEL